MTDIGQKSKNISFRPKPDVLHRLERLAAATERSNTYFIVKCLEAHLPVLEKLYKAEIEAVRQRRKENPDPPQKPSPFRITQR